MKSRSVSILTAAAIAAGALAVPAVASAQSYGGYYGSQGYGSNAYDPCVREARERSVTGGVLGAVVGAVAGGNIAARNARTEGAVIGAIAGAAIGANAGRGSAACGTYQDPYDRHQQPVYQGGYGGYGGYGYDPRYDDRRYDDRQGGYGGYGGYGYPARDDRAYDQGRTGYEDCRMVENNIRMPDGRYERRMVRACRDSEGRFRIVD